MRSGTPDDRWVYVNNSPFSNYSGIGALAAASRGLRGYNDPLATECLALGAEGVRRGACEAGAPATPQTGPGARFGATAELTAVMQLMTATKEK